MRIDGAETIIKALLGEIVAKLQQAEHVARAAQACAGAGGIPEAIHVSLDLDQTVYDVGRLHDSVTLLARLARDEE